jgi:uncharacterized protein YcfJ
MNMVFEHSKRILLAAAAVLALGTLPAAADECSGHSHDTGTALGAAGGAAIGGLASHSLGGALIGGVAGGFAGNAIARNNDCDHHHDRHHRRESYRDRDGHRHYYSR